MTLQIQQLSISHYSLSNFGQPTSLAIQPLSFTESVGILQYFFLPNLVQRVAKSANLASLFGLSLGDALTVHADQRETPIPPVGRGGFRLRARSVPREPFSRTIPTWMAWLIHITFDQLERFLIGFREDRTSPKLSLSFHPEHFSRVESLSRN